MGYTIATAALALTNVYGYSCVASTTNVYAPAATLTAANATWQAWSQVSMGAPVGRATFAHGYNATCPAAPVGFDVTTGVRSAAAAGRATQTFVHTGVDESADPTSWKKFSLSSARLLVTYTPTA